MQNKISNYYDKHLNPKNIGTKFQNKDYPLEVFINMDHISTKKRRENPRNEKKICVDKFMSWIIIQNQIFFWIFYK